MTKAKKQAPEPQTAPSMAEVLKIVAPPTSAVAAPPPPAPPGTRAQRDAQAAANG